MSASSGKVALANVAEPWMRRERFRASCRTHASWISSRMVPIMLKAGRSSADRCVDRRAVTAGARTRTTTATTSRRRRATGLVPRNRHRSRTSAASRTQPLRSPPANPIMTVTQPAGIHLSLAGFDDSASTSGTRPGNGIASVIVSGGQSTTKATYSVTLQAGFYGMARFTASLSDGTNPAVAQGQHRGHSRRASTVRRSSSLLRIRSRACQDSTPFTVNLTGNDDHNAYNGLRSAGTDSGDNQRRPGNGERQIHRDVRPAFNGTATFTASLTDGVNPW